MVTNTDTSPANPRTVVYSYGYDKDRVTSFTLDCQGDTVGTTWTITAGYEYDKDGNVKPVKIEKTKKHVPPDVTAQIFWLKNRQRDRWQDRPQDYVDQTSDNDAEVQIYLPDNGRDD